MNKKLIKLGVIDLMRGEFDKISINHLDGSADGGGSGGDAIANAEALATEAAKVEAAEAAAKVDAGNTDESTAQQQSEEGSETPQENEGEAQHTIDDDGNLVDPEGNILGAADSFETDDDGNYIIPEVPLISTVQAGIETELGLNLVDESGNPMMFEDTEAGMTQMVQAAASVIAEQEKANWLETFPDLEKYYTHIAAGNSKESFFSVGNQWRETQLPADDVATEEANTLRKNVIVEEFLKNYDYDNASADQKTALRNRATKLVGMYEDDGTLATEAKYSLNGLQGRETAQESERDAANRQKINADKQARTEYWNNLANTVKSGDLGDISIPTVDRQAFLDYIGKDVTGNGESQEMLDMRDESPAKTLQLSYLRFKKFSLGHLVGLRKQSAKANTLSQKRSRSVKVASTQGGRSSHVASNNDVSKININNIKF